MTAPETRPTRATGGPAPERRTVEDVEAALSQRFAAELDEGGLRTRLRTRPIATLAGAVSTLRLLARLPVVTVTIPSGGESDAVERLLRGYPVDRLLTLGAAAVLPIPAEPDAYLLGHDRATVRRKVRAAERKGVAVRPVAAEDQAALVDLADQHERTNERLEYRIATPDNADLLRIGLWLAAYSAQGEPLALAVVPVAGEWSVLRHFRTLVSTSESSDARYLLTAALVEALAARGVRHLVDPLPPRWLPNGLRHFQRMLGFRLIRLRSVRRHGRSAP